MKALEALLDIGRKPENLDRIVSAGGIPRLVALLGPSLGGDSSQQLQAVAAGVIACIATSPNHKVQS